MKIISKKILLICCIIFFIGLAGCKKFIEVDSPITSTNKDIVYATDESAISVLTSIYTRMSQGNIIVSAGGITSMPLMTGLYSDEFQLYSGAVNPEYIAYFQNDLNATVLGTANFWNYTYPLIFITNSAIEGISGSTTLSPSVKKQLLGEAKFMRAFCYLYLVNLYNDVPLIISTDYKMNALITRTPSTIVYQQIITDLKEAENLLSENYVDGSVIKTTKERTSPNKWAARALLARVFLYTKDYNNSESYSTTLINNKTLFDLVDINSVFLKNSQEAIWQLQPVGSFVTNTWEGRIFGLPATGPNSTLNPVSLTNSIVNDFESGDLRKSNWIGSAKVGNDTYYYPSKYKATTTFIPVTEYSMVLRLAEQYLIRAEARINQGKIAEGISDLNIIRTRARAFPNSTIPNPLAPLPINLTRLEAKSAVERERKSELFTEWGHRWFDLRRTEGFNDPSKTRADELLPSKGNNNWQKTDLLFPIPQIEIDKTPTLRGYQNPGY